MTQFDRITLGRQARELGFVRDTLKRSAALRTCLPFWKATLCCPKRSR